MNMNKLSFVKLHQVSCIKPSENEKCDNNSAWNILHFKDQHNSGYDTPKQQLPKFQLKRKKHSMNEMKEQVLSSERKVQRVLQSQSQVD